MEAGGVRAAVDDLVAIDVSVADHGEIAVASKSVARIQAFVDLAKVQIARRGRELADQGDTTSAHALIDEGRCTGTDAKATNGRDQVCATLPEFEAALAAAAVTGAHLDVLHQHTKNLTDEERADLADVADSLVADAAAQPASLFDRNVKGLVDKIREIHRPGSDADELDRQRQASKVKRWTERDTGMKQTLISLDPLRDASLWNVYSTCAHPNCEIAFSACRIHHIEWWTNGGATVLANLVPLCETHHHLVHEGRWTLEIDEQRHVTWTRPDGTIWLTDTGPNRAITGRRRPPGRTPDPPPDLPPPPAVRAERFTQSTLL